MPDFKSDLRCFAGFQGGGSVSPRAYGAKADGSTDDTAAIQAAHDQCANAGGGNVIIDGVFRVTTTITWDSNVSAVGVGGVGADYAISNAAIIMDHPNNSIFQIFGGNEATPTRFENIYFGGRQANTGIVFLINGGSGGAQRVLFNNVTFNPNPDSGLLKGDIILASGSGTVVTVHNSRFHISGTSRQGMILGSGSVGLVTDTFFATASNSASASSAIEVQPGGRVQVSNSSFIGGGGFSGFGRFIYVHTSGSAIVTGCHFEGDTPTGTAWSAFYWDDGPINAAGNTYGDFAYPINYITPPTFIADKKSKIDLIPTYKIGSLGTSYTVLSGFEAAELQVVGSSFTVTMPAKLYYGQRLRLAIQNNSGSTWAPVFIGSGAPSNHSFPSAITGGGAFVICEFIVSDIFGSVPTWYIIT